ncbi:MAG: hypothetical protein J2P57_09705 [Acidimicrobiaceae bacterium]|nr:hypothetical protein [Acidimicrobiaceae bacterium]
MYATWYVLLEEPVLVADAALPEAAVVALDLVEDELLQAVTMAKLAEANTAPNTQDRRQRSVAAICAFPPCS